MSKEERREGTRWWAWGLALLVATMCVLGPLGYLGRIGEVTVEREVFERSYQRSEGLESQIATFEAQIAESEARLKNPELTEGARSNIEAQLAALRVQLGAAKRKQQ